MTERLYKCLRADLTSGFGFLGPWVPGEWRREAPPLVPCEHGLHVVPEAHLIEYLDAVICPAEVRGVAVYTRSFPPIIVDDPAEADKWTCEEVRIDTPLAAWNERTARLFAADCAEHVLPLFERDYPHDGRAREAIRVARAYAEGHATVEELAAAGAAAWAAARAAAGDAARAAARAAAGAAAGAAAWDAAGDAAWEAAWAAERACQNARLLAYLRGEVA